MDEEYAYFSTPYGAVIPFSKEEDASFRAAEGIGTTYTMEQREDTSYVVRKQDGTEYVFDSALVLAQIVENGLVKYRFDKNAEGQITQISGRHGSSLNLSYTGGHLSEAADSQGNTAVFTYQEGRLTAVRNSAGKSISFAYEAGLLSTIADFAGQVYLTNTYDAYGRVSDRIQLAEAKARQRMTGRTEKRYLPMRRETAPPICMIRMDASRM